MKYVGLSFSFCIKEILEGKLPAEAVAFIVPAFNWPGHFTGKAPEHYYKVYWSKWPKETVDALLDKLEIRCRPGPTNSFSTNISRGIWMTEEDYNETNYNDPDCRLRTEELEISRPADANDL